MVIFTIRVTSVHSNIFIHLKYCDSKIARSLSVYGFDAAVASEAGVDVVVVGVVDGGVSNSPIPVAVAVAVVVPSLPFAGVAVTVFIAGGAGGNADGAGAAGCGGEATVAAAGIVFADDPPLLMVSATER